MLGTVGESFSGVCLPFNVSDKKSGSVENKRDIFTCIESGAILQDYQTVLSNVTHVCANRIFWTSM